MSQYCVPWFEDYALVYRLGCKTHTVDVEEIVGRFAGLEEAAYFEMLHRFRVPMPRRPRPRTLPYQSDPNSLRIRVIRLYATHAPHRLTLKLVEEALALMKREGAAQIMSRLVNKHGAEPVTLRDGKARIRVLLAAYDQWDRLPVVDAHLRLYRGDEEAYLRRLISELGGEPQEVDAQDAYDTRSRVRRFLTLNDPMALTRLETLLARFEGKDLELMAMLQRRYGKEPTEKEVQDGLGKKDAAYQKQQQELKEQRERAAKQRAEKQRQQELERHDKMTAIGVYSWDTGPMSTMHEMPNGVQRAGVILQLRAVLEQGRRLKEERCVQIVRELLSFYNRPLVEFAEALIQARVAGNVDERMEFLAFLEQLYVNQVPLSATESLRTVLSLLEMQLGRDGIEEVKQAGSLGAFLSQVDAKSEREWVGYLTSVYGHATEEDLALRSRLRFFFQKARPGMSAEAVEVEIQNAWAEDKHEGLPRLLEAMRSRYGAEPPFRAVVNKPRVLRLLDRNAPGKLAKIDIVIQAHTYPGESAATAMDRILRTYGSEQTGFDSVMAKFDAAELESRFGVWVQQTRLRNIFARRLKAVENPDMDVLQSVIEATAKYTDARQQQSSAQAAKDAAQAQAAAAAAAAVADDGFEAKSPEELLEHQEKVARSQIAQAWRQDLYANCENQPHLATLLDKHIEVAELLTRVAELDVAMAKYEAFQAQMREEEAELREWLRHRLVWRDQWARDEEANREKARRERDKQMILEAEAEDERRRKDSDAANEAAAHFQAMQDLRESLHTQATKVLQYQAKLQLLRTRGNLGLTRNSVDVETHRHVHEGCVFNKNGAYNANVKPLHIVVVDDRVDYFQSQESADATVDPATADKSSWEYVFKRQCRSYVERLLKAYDPARLSTLDAIMRRYNNREHDLIAALEQQCDIDHSRTSDLVDRVKEYYQRMAPDRQDEMDVVLKRFNHQAELIWPFLYTQYGAHPRRRGPELREYLRQRLGCYLARVAPKLLPDVDRMIDQCPMLGCESLFRELTSKFGPEGPQFEQQSMERKLTLFYSRRRMNDVLPHVPAIAKRFAGRYKLLNEILGRMFNDTLERITED